MYTAPTIRELGAVATYTLGSSHPGGITTNKGNNSNADFFTAFNGDKGTPCTTVPGGIPC